MPYEAAILWLPAAMHIRTRCGRQAPAVWKPGIQEGRQSCTYPAPGNYPVLVAGSDSVGTWAVR